MSSAATIRGIAEAMTKSPARYDEQALSIWGMLTKEEREELRHIVTARPAVYDGFVVKDPVRQKLVDAKLATRSKLGCEEGYTRITFVGYAVYRIGFPEKIEDPVKKGFAP